MSLRIRGQELTMRVAIDGVTVDGSMFKVMDFTVTPRTDIQEADYLGESETDLDVQHHGYDLSWSVDMQDAKTIDLLDDLASRNLNVQRPQDVTIVVIYNFRESGTSGRIIAYHEAVLKVDEEGASGRKERVKTKFTAKAKTREPLSA